MPFAFYMDHNVDDRITEALRLRGIDVIVAREEGHDRTLDPLLLDRVYELSRVFCTHDKDFLREGVRRQREGIPFCGVVYSHMNTNVGRCIRGLVEIYYSNDQEDMMNTVMYVT